jgi:hypothetical protein
MTHPIPEHWLPEANVRRVICHWTAGTHRATLIDRVHYHLLIQGDGTLVRGLLPIGRWPPHTRRLNAGSIGVALCGMAGAVEEPLNWGPWPISSFQMNRLVAVVAQLVTCYDLPIRPDTVLSHAEVPTVYGLPQRGRVPAKRVEDISVGPGRADLHDAAAVGTELRRRIEAQLKAPTEQ